MLRFGLLICVCLFFLGCALLFAFGSAGSPCFDFVIVIVCNFFWLEDFRFKSELPTFRTPAKSEVPVDPQTLVNTIACVGLLLIVPRS